MKKFEFNPDNFEFDSDIKSGIKLEVQEIKQE